MLVWIGCGISKSEAPPEAHGEEGHSVHQGAVSVTDETQFKATTTEVQCRDELLGQVAPPIRQQLSGHHSQQVTCQASTYNVSY